MRGAAGGGIAFDVAVWGHVGVEGGGGRMGAVMEGGRRVSGTLRMSRRGGR